VTKTTLGETKTANCAVCGTIFEKKRHDQKHCSRQCLTEAKKFYNRSRWFDRPDREAQNQARRKRYHETRPEVAEKARKWRQENPELARAKDKAKYEKNKAKHAERTNAYRRSHPEVRKKEYQTARMKFPWKRPLLAARTRALKKGFSFDLTHEWAAQNWTGKCAVTNLPFEIGTVRSFAFAPSIDRKDSSLGYIQGNCRFVLFAVNSFKGVGTDETMLAIAKALVDYHADLARL
jgi:hypothetical protein